MMSTIFTGEQIKGALADLPDWTFAEDKIRREYRFKSFVEAIGFIAEMAFACEKANHHPELFNVYNRVLIDLTTHDDGNKITQKDVDLAQEIEKIAKNRM
ncbi:MAG: 4a-hydroxytetrahydrobiopterin dehydratase [Verrucomicrobiota bacterium]|nr:4a-hydroxytetrahydrobiopterin dehydratase [Verrucomicrobiota bacterium]